MKKKIHFSERTICNSMDSWLNKNEALFDKQMLLKMKIFECICDNANEMKDYFVEVSYDLDRCNDSIMIRITSTKSFMAIERVFDMETFESYPILDTLNAMIEDF